MNFESLNDLVASHGLTAPHLSLLHPDENLYRCLAMQPEDNVSASPSGVSAPGLNKRCDAFWDLALSSDVDLALTPEYSFSWAVLEAKVQSGALPANGRLWLLGMQSITPLELDQLQRRLAPARVIYDRPWDHGGHGTFLDPACYIFASAEDVPVVVVQFKQSQMGTNPEPIERNHMIHGRHAYYVENDARSVRLACVVCADALSFSPDRDLPTFPGRSYLLLHLQLNPHPRQAAFSAYRGTIFDHNLDSVEVLCLNWAASTTIALPNSAPIALGFPHSGVYWKELNLVPRDTDLLSNHAGSAYYFYWHQRRTHLNVFHDAQHCLLFDATKPSQILGPGASSGRSGIQNPTPLTWNNGAWKQSKLDDGHAALLARTSHRAQQVLGGLDRLELERFVAVCCGQVSATEWHLPTRLPLFRLGADEAHQRVGYCRDPASQLQATEKLAHVSTLADQFPSGFVASTGNNHLLQNTVLAHSTKNRACNIHRNGVPYATAAYVGVDLGGTRAAMARDALKKMFPENEDPLILVWYSENGACACVSTAGDANITSGPTQAASIVGA